MSVTLDITDGYATLAEAGVYLANDTTWQAETSDTNKQDALVWSRWYLTSLYDYDLDSIDAIDEEAKLANCVLAVDYLTNGTLFGDYTNLIKSKTIKADTVQQTITYDNSYTPKPAALGKAMILMDQIADRIGSQSVPLIRD